MIVLIVLVVLVLGLGGGYLFFRSKMRRLPAMIDQQLHAPFTYGVAPPPQPGATAAQNLTVAGQPATLSKLDPRASFGLQSGAIPYAVSGHLYLEVALGPDWPGLGVQERTGTQRFGQYLAKHNDVAAADYPTGDPGFDAQFRTALAAGNPEAARRILTPQVLAVLRDPPVLQMRTWHTLHLEYAVPVGQDPDAWIPGALHAAEVIIRSSGIPVYAGPPRTFTPSP